MSRSLRGVRLLNIECRGRGKCLRVFVEGNVGVLMNFKLFYLRVKLKIQTKLVVEGFDEKRGSMEVLAGLEQ
jgi:hypothetical protein